MMTAKLSVLALLLVNFAVAQDTLKIVSWNLLNYSNASRDQYYQTVLRHVKPDILVVQEMTSQAMVDSFFNRVVNFLFPGQFSKGDFIDGDDTDNAIYYKPTKFTFIHNRPIPTALRDISEFSLFSVAAADTFRIFSVHLKASSGSSNELLRAAEVDSLRKGTNALPNGKYFVVCGDFNIYRSGESAYQKLLQDNPTDDGHIVDPLTLTGTWNDSAYRQYHTQSTRTRQLSDGGATGGLDDRFDMILYSRAASQPGHISFVAGSLTPIGNDGNHFNDSINKMPNFSVPDSVADALYYASDHLPVSARFVFSPSAVTREYAVNGGWNIASLPLAVNDPRKTAVFPSATSSAYAFDQAVGYVVQDSLRNGRGYWLKFSVAQDISITGTVLSLDTIEVQSGWNLIASISAPVPVGSIIQIPSGIVVSSYFGYNSGYFPEDTLHPASGYWVKVNQAGHLVIRSGPLVESPLVSQGTRQGRKVILNELVKNDEINTIILRDVEGRTQKLYFSGEQTDLDLGSCELPPPPPDGALNVRYRSQRVAEVYDKEWGGRQSFPIQIVDASYPVTVSWSVVELGGTYALSIVKEGGEQQHIEMVQHGTLKLGEPGLAFILQIESKSSTQLPTDFDLKQNYPNPFNPSTTIMYDLPVDKRVSLKVFNILGQEVVTLVNEEQKAGYKSAEWNAGNVASGVYFYRLQVGSFVDVKKLLLVR